MPKLSIARVNTVYHRLSDAQIEGSVCYAITGKHIATPLRHLPH